MSPPSKIDESFTDIGNTSTSWYTEIKSIEPGVKHLTDSFFTKQKTHDIQFRLNQLRNLYYAVQDNVDALCEALSKDFNRSASETKIWKLLVD